jgi:hypothetical protein
MRERYNPAGDRFRKVRSIFLELNDKCLKITLLNSKPPIWRRVLVPSGIELEDLHDVIQAAFGWHNCHLHQFIDASGDDHFEKVKNQNMLRGEDMDLIVDTYRERKVIDKFSYKATLVALCQFADSG